MPLPSLLLVDDSESMLAFEQAALSRHFATATARTGAEALAAVQAVRPALMVLDLSMPEMDGDEVLRRLRASAAFADLPVVILSSERARADQCLALGADAVLHKPVKAEELVRTVDEVLARARARERQGSLAVLPLRAGGTAVALPLAVVQSVQSHPATLPLPALRPYLSQAVELRGQVVAVLDLALRLGLEPRAPLEERKLVIATLPGLPLAISVDEVQSPEEILAQDITPRAQLAAPDDAVLAVVRTSAGPVPVLKPEALVSARPLKALPRLLAQLVGGEGAAR